jgi:hypothetical protein
MTKLRFGAAVAATTVLLWGCGRSVQPSPPSSTFVLPSAAAALTPAIYMQLASSSSLFAIRASELAQERGSARTRDVARSVIQDQTGVAAQLSYAGRRVDLLPSATLTEAQNAELERLRASSNFDADYRRAVGETLARALQAHETFARGGASPTLKPVAQMAAPQTRKNLQQVRR